MGLKGNKSRTGMVNSPEMREKISKSMIGKRCGVGNKSRKGQKRSAEELEKQKQTRATRQYEFSLKRRWDLVFSRIGKKRPTHIGKVVAEANKKRTWSNESRKKISEKSKAIWSNEKTASRMIRNIRIASNIKPNKLETFVLELLEKHFVSEWEYSGDGKFMIGRCCPDFIRNHGHNQVIELYGDYWHRNENPQDRIDLFKQYGYDTLVIWEKDIYKMSELEFVELVSKFMVSVIK